MLRGSFIVWTGTLLILATVYLSVYPSFAKDADALRELVNNLPAAAKHFLGVGAMDMFTFVGFFANVSTVFMLALAIQAMNIGISMTNREALARTADFLLTKPVTRTRVFTEKLLASLTVVLATSTIFILYFYLGGKFVDSGSYNQKAFWMICGVLVGVQLWFLTVGILVAQLRGRIRSVIGLSLSIVLALFVLGLFGSAVNDQAVRLITPFKYIDLVKVISYAQYEAGYVLLWLVVAAGSCLAGWWLYKHRDVPSQT